jgi:hypothetical protein
MFAIVFRFASVAGVSIHNPIVVNWRDLAVHSRKEFA